MNVDISELGGGEAIRCDVCIVGAGAAGMTLACELDGSGLDVVLLEAGSTRYEAQQQAALRGDVTDGSRHPPPDMYRRRILGGATTIWGGRCVPLSPIDLEQRDYIPHSGWPITWDELERYYPAAQAYCQAGDYSYKVADSIGGAAAPTIDHFADADIEIDKIERFSPPTDFGKTYRDRMAKSPNVRLMLGTKALRLHEDSHAITRLEVFTERSQHITVLSRHYVLAMGGLETPRLLMISDDTRRGGIGNQGNALGRFYMCHVENTLGLLRLEPATRPAVIGYERTVDGVYARRKLCIAPAAMRRGKLLNTAARFHYPLIANPTHRNGVLSAMYIVKNVVIPEYRRKLATIEAASLDQQTRDARFWMAHLTNVALDAPQVASFGAHWLHRRILARRKLPSVVIHNRSGEYPLDVNAEQIPDRGNFVTLSDSRDTGGQRQIRLRWQLTDQDVDSLGRAMRLLRDAFARTRCASLSIDEPQLDDRIRSSTPVGGHHIGTARMADDPSQGVVDRHCTVHGLHNLHLVGSAVFPTCGHANPTLTIVALTVRLARRLKCLIGAERPMVIGQRSTAQV